MTDKPASPEEEAFWETWGDFLRHVAPDTGPRCAECAASEGPGGGCEEGKRLYEAYRQARTNKEFKLTI